MPDRMVGRPSSNVVRLQARRRISITMHGGRTVPDSSIRPLPCDQHFAMDRSPEAHQEHRPPHVAIARFLLT